ncbi:MAG: hypothetical protein P4L55_20225 [Syntrophobacteraceae bacterium]|nr:hypothetical protein [Syntrophobacteraceae bacterium]
MRQSVQHYRKPGNEPFQPGRSNNQPQVRRPLNEDTEQRIVTLYTSGQSIESITKEVGRARYLVVHVLQSRGVFGNRPTELDCEEPWTEPVAVEDMTQESVVKERAPELIAVNGPESEIATKEPPKKAKRVRKSKSPEQLKSSPAEKPIPKPATPENSSTAGRWSPLLVDALYELVAGHDINTGMTLEDVKKMVSKH